MLNSSNFTTVHVVWCFLFLESIVTELAVCVETSREFAGRWVQSVSAQTTPTQTKLNWSIYYKPLFVFAIFSFLSSFYGGMDKLFFCFFFFNQMLVMISPWTGNLVLQLLWCRENLPKMFSGLVTPTAVATTVKHRTPETTYNFSYNYTCKEVDVAKMALLCWFI